MQGRMTLSGEERGLWTCLGSAARVLQLTVGPHLPHQSSAKVVMSKMDEVGPMNTMNSPMPAADHVRGCAKYSALAAAAAAAAGAVTGPLHAKDEVLRTAGSSGSPSLSSGV